MFIDLSLLVQDDLIIKDLQGEEYKIPGLLTTEMYIKISSFYQQIQGFEGNDIEALDKMQEMVKEILMLDASKNITLDFVKVRFNDIRMLRMIVEGVMKHFANLAADPNSSSLPQGNRAARRAKSESNKQK